MERELVSVVSFVYKRRPQSSLILAELLNPNGGRDIPLNRRARMSQPAWGLYRASFDPDAMLSWTLVSSSQMDKDVKKRVVARAAQNAAGATYDSVCRLRITTTMIECEIGHVSATIAVSQDWYLQRLSCHVRYLFLSDRERRCSCALGSDAQIRGSCISKIYVMRISFDVTYKFRTSVTH